MNVKKVKGGYHVESHVGGYRFGRTYLGYNRIQAIFVHKDMERTARKFGSRWIDQPQFNEYN